jgi:hypothetical protein
LGDVDFDQDGDVHAAFDMCVISGGQIINADVPPK